MMQHAWQSVDWSAFLAVVMVAYLIPGPDFFIILGNSTRGWRPGAAAAVGAQTGLCAHMLLAVAGLSVVLTRYPLTLTVVRILGAAYLLYLAVRLLRSSASDTAHATRGSRPFAQGLFTNLLNPKAALFFFSVLPQFIDPTAPIQAQILVLGVADILIGFLPWALVITAGVRATTWLDDERRRRRWDRITGAILGVLAIWLLAP